MNPERWQQIERIYDRVLELEPGQRAAFLEETCTGDESLRKEVERLLARQSDAEHFIESPAIEMAARALAEGEAQKPQEKPQESLVGRTLLHYRIVEKVGEGGMGVVYRAEDSHLKRSVAIKLLPSERMADAERKKRFIHEARAASALNHPNIITIHDISSADGIDFIVMEYVAGRPLTQLIGGKGLPLPEALKYAMQIADALEKAHRAGIIHRDLKPSNIMVTDDGMVKVLDFGLAKLMQPAQWEDAGSTASLTQSGAIVGTAAYMSPEQAEGKAVDARSDIFSFGSVLYEMVTGRRAFSGDSNISTLAAVLHEEPEPIGRITGGIPQELERVIAKALEKGREVRYQTAKDMLADLERLKRDSESERAGLAKAARELLLRRPWRWALSLGIAALALATVVVVLVGLNVANLRGRLPGGVTAPRIESLAVLSLANLSGDPEQDYFADGMTEELTATLGKLTKLRVISRTSVMRYKKTEKPIPQIAKELNVDAVIEGSVLRAGNRVRITVRLIQASADRQMWSETYDRDLRDVLALQSEVASAIGDQVRAKLTPQQQERLADVRPVNPDAYLAYLKGNHYINQWNEEGLKKARASFQQALDFDPTFAPAFQGLAEVYWWLGLLAFQPPTEVFPLAKEEARKALELDEGLAEAHTALGQIKYVFDWDWSGAELELKRATVLNPSSSLAHREYASFSAAMGRSDEAVREARKALELDPLTPSTNVDLGWVLFFARRYDESIAQLKKVLELNPNFAWAYTELSWNYAQKRMYPEAVAACRKAAGLAPQDQEQLADWGLVYGLAGRRQEAYEILDQLRKTPGYLDPYGMASVYGGIGDKDRAVEWLERAYRERSPSMWGLKMDVKMDEWWTDALRSDPRFQALLHKMNFPEK